MDSVSPRTCERDGCEQPVTGKATARFCSPSCRREHSRQQGDGNTDRVWVRGHWKQKPRKRQSVQRRPRQPDPALTLVCAALLVAAGQERPKVGA